MIIECDTSYLSELNEMLKFFNTQISKESMEDNPYSIYFGYLSNKELIAFINFNILYEQAELNYIYVKPEFRGTKVGTLLMEEMFKKCYERMVSAITLEVRMSNTGAIQFYKNLGFEEISIRKNYYKEEDAYLLQKVIK